MKLTSWKFANLKTSWKTNKQKRQPRIHWTHISKRPVKEEIWFIKQTNVNFNNLKQSFGDSILSGKMTLDKAGKNQNNLLINISKVNDTERAGSKADRFQFVVFKPLS